MAGFVAFEERVLRPTRDAIAVQLEGRDRWNPAVELASMTRQTVHDYGGRFLLELIQNGYDAHPVDGSDGQVSIVLDEDEGEFGTLYLANAGRPFTDSNYAAIRRLGMSDKPPGGSIGNKGVGFKSVLQVTDRPEVYSADPGRPHSGRLDGYCFGLGDPVDLERLLGIEPPVARLLCQEMPRFALTVPCLEVPPTAAGLAAEGHVTVVRLPLRGQAALEQARQRLRELRANEVPILLFLPRLERLVFEHRHGEGAERDELVRSSETVTPESALDVVVEVDDLGERGRFLVANRAVPVDRLTAAIEAGIGDEELDESWRRWDAPAVVSVAVPICHEISDFRSYTFLPMGRKAASPFAGHLNAPFRTFLNRTDIDETEHLNRVFIEVAAEACLLAVETLKQVDIPGARAAAADLASWDDSHLEFLQDACRRLFGEGLRTQPLWPVAMGAGQRWVSAVEAWQWPDGGWDVLTRERALSATGAALLDDDLGEARTNRLMRLADAFGESLDPTDEQLAGWVERIVSKLPRSSDSLKQWELLYDDLAVMFDQDATALQGRPLLLDESWRLRPCNAPTGGGKRRARPSSAFFQPVRGRVEGEDEVEADADVRIPSELNASCELARGAVDNGHEDDS